MNILNKLGLMTVAEHEAASRPLRQKLFDSEQKRIHWQGEAFRDIATQSDIIGELRPAADAHRRRLERDRNRTRKPKS